MVSMVGFSFSAGGSIFVFRHKGDLLVLKIDANGGGVAAQNLARPCFPLSRSALRRTPKPPKLVERAQALTPRVQPRSPRSRTTRRRARALISAPRSRPAAP